MGHRDRAGGRSWAAGQARLPAVVTAVAVVTVAGYAALAAALASHPGMLGDVGPGVLGPLAVVMYCLAAVSCPAVGGMVVTRRPEHPGPGKVVLGVCAGESGV